MLFIAEKPKNFPPYQEVSVDFNQANETIQFSELQFHKLDDNQGYIALMVISSAKTVFDKHKDYLKADSLYCLVFNAKEYEKNKKEGDTWVKEKKQPSPFESYFCEMLDTLSDRFIGKTLLGTLNIIGNEDTVSKYRKLGENAIDLVLEAKEVEDAKLLKPVDLEAAKNNKNGGKGGYSRGQTEAEKLKDKWDFLLAKLGIEESARPTTTFPELGFHLKALQATDKEAYLHAKSLLESFMNWK